MGNITIKSPSGVFSGKSANGINTFYGIPYAQSCSGKNRWRAPKKINLHHSHQESIKGPSAYQTLVNKSFMFDPTLPDSSEDCLNLNIGSPENASNLPVMIWIHGGAYLTGSANGALYSMEALASKGVILVTLNYRLGPLGFLKLDEVTNGLIPSTGNEGLLDQRLAIQWVKENIEAFGGDPDNITIFGESAGAWSCALQVAPVVDNKILKENYIENFEIESFDLIAGVTLDEYKLWSLFHPLYKNLSKENLIKRLSKIFKHSIEDIIDLYSDYIDDNNYGNLLSSIMTDLTFGCPVEELLKRKKDSYGYIFTPQSPLLNGELGAFHASELPYLFGVQNNSVYKKWTPDYRDKTAEIMQESWVNFAKNANPSMNNFKWERFSNSSNYALIGEDITNINSPFKERYQILNYAKNF